MFPISFKKAKSNDDDINLQKSYKAYALLDERQIKFSP